MKENSSLAIYLSYNGNCRQAFDYYQSCFGGELSVQTMADTPHAMAMSRQMRKAVICATLQTSYFKLIGTDLADSGKIIAGNNISILLECASSRERTELILKLTGMNCGTAGASAYINVTDRYSVHWVFSLVVNIDRFNIK